MKKKVVWKSAITGRFVSEAFAKAHPETTYALRVETKKTTDKK